MEFSYSEELLEIKRIVRDFAEREIRPHVREWDEKQIFPREVLKKLAELGFMGVLVPTEYGGARFALYRSHLQLRQWGAAPEVRSASCERRKTRRVEPYRTGSRQRRRWDANRGAIGWR